MTTHHDPVSVSAHWAVSGRRRRYGRASIAPHVIHRSLDPRFIQCVLEPSRRPLTMTYEQGLTLVHFSAQLERFLWDKGCMQGLFRWCVGGFRGYEGVLRVYFVSENAQVELKSGRV